MLNNHHHYPTDQAQILQATDLLSKTQDGTSPPLDFVSKWLLSSIVMRLDEWGAWQWNLRLTAVITSVFLLLVRTVLHKKHDVDWHALIHAIVSGVGSVICVYLDVFASEAATGLPEPLRAAHCMAPLTSLHRILPAITMGYSFYDVLDGFSLSIDFALHGLGTLAVMLYYCEYNVPQLVVPMLLMEVSTIFLALVRADFFSDTVCVLNQAVFVLCFFVFRIVLCPIMWFQIIWALWSQHNTEQYHACFPWHFLPFTFLLGFFFHLLNMYWFVKIIKKARRKIMGLEKSRHNNDLIDEEEKQNRASKNKRN